MADTSGLDEERPPGDDYRLGAKIFFSLLLLLVLVALVTLACACKQRAVRRRGTKDRWAKLLSHYKSVEEGAANSSEQPLRAASERLLPGPPRSHSSAMLRYEVAALAEKKRAAAANAWWAVIATWIVTAAAAVMHTVLAGRLGLLSLDPSAAESPGKFEAANPRAHLSLSSNDSCSLLRVAGSNPASRSYRRCRHDASVGRRRRRRREGLAAARHPAAVARLGAGTEARLDDTRHRGRHVHLRADAARVAAAAAARHAVDAARHRGQRLARDALLGAVRSGGRRYLELAAGMRTGAQTRGLATRSAPRSLQSLLLACHMPLLSSPTFEPLRGKVCVLMLLAATAQTTLPLPTLSHAWLAELTSTAAAAAPNAATAVAAAAKASGLADEMGAADSSWLRIELKLGCSIALFA